MLEHHTYEVCVDESVLRDLCPFGYFCINDIVPRFPVRGLLRRRGWELTDENPKSLDFVDERVIFVVKVGGRISHRFDSRINFQSCFI